MFRLVSGQFVASDRRLWLIHPSKQPIEQPRHHDSNSERLSNSKPSTRATASRDEAGVTWL
jgi:hypothetical protein